VVTPPPRRKPEKAAKAFYTRRLKRILINPAIAGLRAYHGEIVGNATWPPILDHATWAAARAILLAPERQAGGRPHRWPIAGLAVCGNPNCGETLRTKFTGRATVYACDPAEWLEMRQALMDRMDATKRQLERRAEMPREQLNGSKPIHEVWNGWTIEQKRAVLRALFRCIVILPATKRGRGEDPDRVQPEWLA
jgi:hypothetical protein